ncbi:MAG: poly-gamma-glutamate hydrolase family protein [Pseudomonadales bacterium]
MDIYANFEELLRKEGDKAFEISVLDRQAAATIVAPHGGNIEPGTTELAQLIAGDNFNFYSFIATKEQHSPDLHITSHNFDEPTCLALLKHSQQVITVHGFKFDRAMIYVGGLDQPLKTLIHHTLLAEGLPVADDHPKYQGVNPLNICNRGLSGKGVQLEVSRHLRSSSQAQEAIAKAIQQALKNHNNSLVKSDTGTI